MQLSPASSPAFDTLKFCCEIDFRWRSALRSILMEAAEGRKPLLLLDFANVEYIDSNGLGVLIEYHRNAQANGGQLAVCGLRRGLVEMFEVSRLERFIPLFPTVEAGREALAGVGI